MITVDFETILIVDFPFLLYTLNMVLAVFRNSGKHPFTLARQVSAAKTVKFFSEKKFITELKLK